MWKIRSNIVEYNQIGHGKAIHRHIIFLPILLAVSSCSLQIEKNPPFSTISETCFHISLQFLKLTLIFSTNSISLRFWELDFTGKYFSTISETCFHLSTISETHFHLSTISISLQFWTHPSHGTFCKVSMISATCIEVDSYKNRGKNLGFWLLNNEND